TRTACEGTPEMPALPAHEIHAGVRWPDRERCDDHRAGAWSAGTEVETTVCAYGRQNTLPLVRTILQNGRSRRSIEDLFRGRLPLLPWQKFRRHRPCSCAG